MPLLVQLQFSGITWLWLIACLLLGGLYAFVLYGKSSGTNRRIQIALFAFRTLAVALIAFLLFAPPIRRTEKTSEKPLIILAHDNSASVMVSKPAGFDSAKYHSAIRKLERDLSGEYEIRSFNFSSDIKDSLGLDYKGGVTNISAVFDMIESRFSNRNLGALILASDGIYNQGSNPRYAAADLKSSIYTLALGDTIPKKDILIANVNYNKIAYLDNQFQIEVSAEAFQTVGANPVLTVSDKSGTVFSKTINIRTNEFRTVVPLTLSAKAIGVQQYTIRISTVAGELSTRNNSQVIFVEVIDGRQKLLLAANSPHPDLSAIKQSVEMNKNYSLTVKMAAEITQQDVQESGLVIMHQLPSQANPAKELFQWASEKPVWYILGAQSNVASFSASNPILGITSPGNFQEVTAHVQDGFYAFTLSEDYRTRISNFGPLLSPFGNYGLKGPASVLLQQQIGKVATEIPLLAVMEDSGRKIGVLTGEGIWRWRLEDFQENGNHDAVNDLLSKTIQYLTVKDDKRKFRAYPAKTTFDENENIALNAELYNDAFELQNGPDVNVSLKNNEGKVFSYVFSRTANAYSLDAGILPAGEYSFTANTQLGNAKHTARGQFVVSQQLAEFRQTVANHQLLYAMASESGGKMLFPNQIDQLSDLIRSNELIKTITYEDRKYDELLGMKFLFFLILTLLTIEWFVRKRNGQV